MDPLQNWDELQALLCCFNGERISDKFASELTGLLRGILIDGRVSRDEAAFLYEWCTKVQNTVQKERTLEPVRRFVEACYPVCQEIIAGADPNKLKEMLEAFGGKGSYKGCLDLLNPKDIDLTSSFCLTGTFSWKERGEVAKTLEGAGAKVYDKLVKDVRFLVVGDEETKSWATTSYGRKIERAMQWKNSGHQIWIISEHALKARFEGDDSYKPDPEAKLPVTLREHVRNADKSTRVWFPNPAGGVMSIELSRANDAEMFGALNIGPTKEGPWFPLADGIELLNSLPIEERQLKRLNKLGAAVPASCTYVQAKKLIRDAEGLLSPTTECLTRMAVLGIKADPSWTRDQCNAALYGAADKP
jgi:hypothetical protein